MIFATYETNSNKKRRKVSRSSFLSLTALLLAVLMLIMLAGCAGSGATSSSKQDASDVSGTVSADNQPALTVITSFYPMYDFASRIGGSRIDLTNMVPSGVEPHSWEPSAGDIVKLEKADVFIYNGAGMEHWVDTILSAVSSKSLIVVETADGLELREGHDHDEDHEDDVDNEEESHTSEEVEHDLDDGHDHGDQDPHVWLDPLLAIKQMSAIRDAFVTADPEGADFYNDNFTLAKAEFEALDAEFHSRLENLASRELIVSHEAYGYLAGAYDLEQIAISGLSPEDEPSPARMAEIIEIAEHREISVIFFEELVSPKVAQTIANAVGAETAVLSTLEGLTDEQSQAGDDYISVMRKNLETIEHYMGKGA
ncbi:MAG: zinc ABC transporter solute-binding protein [Clostridiaceae bacterium]|nr:zinc ABC transporter solute-binding protein [Clostridiaceae bacterium]